MFGVLKFILFVVFTLSWLSVVTKSQYQFNLTVNKIKVVKEKKTADNFPLCSTWCRSWTPLGRRWGRWPGALPGASPSPRVWCCRSNSTTKLDVISLLLHYSLQYREAAEVVDDTHQPRPLAHQAGHVSHWNGEQVQLARWRERERVFWLWLKRSLSMDVSFVQGPVI